MVDINCIPQPFKEFLSSKSQADSIETIATSASTAASSALSASSASFAPKNINLEPNQRNDMQDFLFLAAILMLCDD